MGKDLGWALLVGAGAYGSVLGGLGTIGLSGVGPAAGSYFAGAQAAGSVAAGSGWAWLQAFAMGGAAMTPLGLGIVAGSAFFGGKLLYDHFDSKDETDETDDCDQSMSLQTFFD